METMVLPRCRPRGWVIALRLAYSVLISRVKHKDYKRIELDCIYELCLWADDASRLGFCISQELSSDQGSDQNPIPSESLYIGTFLTGKSSILCDLVAIARILDFLRNHPYLTDYLPSSTTMCGPEGTLSIHRSIRSSYVYTVYLFVV